MIPNHGPMMDFGLGEAADAIRETTTRFAAAVPQSAWAIQPGAASRLP